MGSIFSSTSLPKEEQKDEEWLMVDLDLGLEEEKVEEEVLEEEEEPPQEEVKEGQDEEEEEEEEVESTLPEPHNTFTLLPPYLTRIIIHGLGHLDCLVRLRSNTGLM
jgi:hypothetical protein